MKVPEHIRKLMLHHVLDDLSPAQENELWDWRRISSDNEAIFQETADKEKIWKGVRRMIDSEKIVWQKIQQRYPMKEYDSPDTTRRRTMFLRIALIGAAAVFIVFLGVRVWMNVMQIIPGKQEGYFFSHLGFSPGIISNDKNTAGIKDEVRLEITDNGEKMLVAKNMFLASESDTDKLIVPTGGRFALQLQGVGIFRLNSESAVYYPANFSKDSLNLTILGEVFVDLAKSTKRIVCFKVHDIEIRALHARFNIQSHFGEMTKITLLSGQLNIAGYPGARHFLLPITLQPGQQLNFLDNVARIVNADTIAAAAWKNGRTYYRNENILTIMRSLSRWYNFDFNIDPSVAGKSFDLDQPRDAPIITVMNELQRQGIHYSIRNRVVTIKP